MQTQLESKLQSKLDAVRQELKTMTGHWRKEWQEAILKWSEMICTTTLAESTIDAREVVKLPTDYGASYYLISLWKYGSARNIDDVHNYYTVHANKYLSVIPLNLVVVIYRHLVLAFGGEFLHIEAYRRSHIHIHYLWTGSANSSYKHHRAVIHSAASNHFIRFNESNAFDGWEKISIFGFQDDDKLKPSYYSSGLLTTLLKYQRNRMIEYHFGQSSTSEKTSSAKTLLNRLIVVIGKLCVVDNDDSTIQFLIGDYDEQNNFDLDFDNTMKIQAFSKMIGNLTFTDVNFIVSNFIESERGMAETIEKIKQSELQLEPTLTNSNGSNGSINSTGSIFPDLNDDFTNFDPLHLRGLLAETTLSRKLRAHALGLEEIREMNEMRAGSFAAAAPLAVVKIASEYLSVDLSSKIITDS